MMDEGWRVAIVDALGQWTGMVEGGFILQLSA
jgi:hypothetical protein